MFSRFLILTQGLMGFGLTGLMALVDKVHAGIGLEQGLTGFRLMRFKLMA